MLSIYFLMTIQYGMDTETLAKKYEPFMHVFALAPPLMTAIIGVAKQMYFSETTNCWLGDICQSFDNRPNRNMFGSVIWVLLVSVCFLVISTATTIFSMLAIYWTLRQRKLATLRYISRPESDAENRRQTEIEFTANEMGK